MILVTSHKDAPSASGKQQKDRPSLGRGKTMIANAFDLDGMEPPPVAESKPAESAPASPAETLMSTGAGAVTNGADSADEQQGAITYTSP